MKTPAYEYKEYRGLLVAPDDMQALLDATKRTEEEWAQFVGPAWYLDGFAIHLLSNFHAILEWTAYVCETKRERGYKGKKRRRIKAGTQVKKPK